MRFIHYKFWRLGRALKVPAKFKSSLWQELNARLNAEQPSGNFAFWQSWLARPLPRRLSGVLAGLILVATSLTNAYAYVSPRVAEGSLLYPLKQTLEAAEEITKFTPAAKADFYLKKIERREAERQRLEQSRQRAVRKRFIKRQKILEAKIDKLNNKLSR